MLLDLPVSSNSMVANGATTLAACSVGRSGEKQARAQGSILMEECRHDGAYRRAGAGSVRPPATTTLQYQSNQRKRYRTDPVLGRALGEFGTTIMFAGRSGSYRDSTAMRCRSRRWRSVQ